MKNLVSIIILIFLSQSVFGKTDLPVFLITSDCVESLEVKNTYYGLGWTLIINLNKNTAKSLLAYSEKHLREKVCFIDGNNNEITTDCARIQSPISTPFHVSGINSKVEAINTKNTILSTTGKCGSK